MLDLSLGSDMFKTNLFDAAAQELDILFNTENTELIGDPSFGTYFDEYLWTLSPTTTALNQYIEKIISNTVFASKLQHHVNIDNSFNDSTYENVYTVTITLYNDFSSIEKTYTLSETL